MSRKFLEIGHKKMLAQHIAGGDPQIAGVLAAFDSSSGLKISAKPASLKKAR